MLIETIIGRSYQEAKESIQEASRLVDGIEIRLDALPYLSLDEIHSLQKACKGLHIFTLRGQDQGGLFTGKEEERRRWIVKLAKLAPSFFDLECDLPLSLQQEVAKTTNLLISFHDFITMPEDLAELFSKMKSPYAKAYKIALLASSTTAALKLMSFVKEKSQEGLLLTGIPLGPKGSEVRLLGPIVGNLFDYVGPLGSIGQLSKDLVLETYFYKRLDPNTQIYALIGDPVDKSYGALFHNRLFKEKGKNSLYIRLQVSQEELPDLLPEMLQLPFKGLSVTSPLKELIVPYLHSLSEEAKAIGAVNTVSFIKGELRGSNTDGKGALQAIYKYLPCKSVQGLSILVLGAGGAARAICYELCKQGGSVTVINRTIAKAKKLADLYECKAASFSYLEEKDLKVDLLINTLPHSAFEGKEGEALSNTLLPSYCMDIVSFPWISFLLTEMQKRGSQVILGGEMFFYQALLQQTIWDGSTNKLIGFEQEDAPLHSNGSSCVLSKV